MANEIKNVKDIWNIEIEMAKEKALKSFKNKSFYSQLERLHFNNKEEMLELASISKGVDALIDLTLRNVAKVTLTETKEEE